MISRYTFLIAIVATATISAEQNNGITLRESVRRQAPAPVLQTRQRELFPKSLKEMIPYADLVLQGSVITSESYLSTDERDIYTDYTIAPLRVLYQRSAQSLKKPGAPVSVTLRRWGGRITIEGVSVTQEDLDLRQFKVGEELFLILVFDKSDGRFYLPSPVSGAFLIQHERLEPLVDHPTYQRVRGLSLDDLQSLISRLIR